MKKVLLSLIVMLAVQSAFSQSDPFLELPRESPAASVIQRIGLTDIAINYSSPAVQGREIWGTLVPYNEGKPFPWRAGANENTTIMVTDDVKINGQPLKAGTYGIHIIPRNGDWTVIFSHANTAWGSFTYRLEEDALRITVTPQEESEFREWLTYEFSEKGPDYTVASLVWEYKRIPFRIEIDVHTTVINKVKEQLRDLRQTQWQPWNYAANYCLENNVAFDQALEWAEASIQRKETFYNLKTKSEILAKMGKSHQANLIMQSALNHPTADAETLYSYGRVLIGKGKIAEAAKVYELNAERYPNEWLAEHGLARVYSAKGNFKKAMELEKKALAKAPEIRKPTIEKYLAYLQNGEDFNRY